MAEDPMEDVVATQPDEASQAQSANGHLWGALIPTSQTLKRLDLWRGQNVYTIGRHQNCDFRLASPKISNVHCEITYRGGEEGGDGKEVTVEDKSTNGTFINGIKIGKGKHMLLEQGNELTLGISIEGAVEEYRYMYRHLGNPNPPSSIFDQYQLSSELGRGAFASVRRAIGIMDGNTYAVKVIQQKRLGVTQQHARMFAREIEILRSLDHPNIVRCFGVYSDPTTIYIVMEYVGGGDLLDVVLKSGSGLEEQEAKGLTRDICIAMEYLHDHAIVHRDIKPENVLITTDSPRRAKIADFGLAKIIDSVTFLRTQCGTPAYLAPEVLDSAATLANGGYTPAVDVWSVGVMVFSMLTMTMPFGDEDEQIPVRERLRTRNANWEAMDNNSHDAQDWVRGMLAKEAPERMTMRDALNHRWLLDPYGDYSFAVPGNATPRSATPTGPRGGFGGGHRGFGGARNGNAPGPSLQGGGGGGGVQESSSVFIYGARALEQENRAPVETGVSSLGLGRMALDSVVVVDPPAKPAPAKAAPVKLGRKRPATTSMEQVVQSPVKKRAAV